MFAAILPGLRELRVPLSSGVLWLVTLWVGLGSLIPPRDASQSLINQIYSLGSAFSGALAIPALAFVAYLVGITLAGLNPRFFFARSRKKGRLGSTLRANLALQVQRELKAAQRRGIDFGRLVEQFPDLESLERSRLPREEREEAAVEELSSSHQRNPPSIDEWINAESWRWIQDQERVSALVDQIASELDLAEVSLQLANRDVYERFDRSKAESEFRFAVAFPIAALGITAGIRLFDSVGWYSALGLLGVFACVYLAISANAREVAANGFIVQSILAGNSDSPTLALMKNTQPAK